MTLFSVDTFGYPRPLPEPGLSPDRRRTIRNQAALDAGRHPVTRLPLLDTGWGFTCGGCSHLFEHRRNQSWWKCELNATRGAATDVRKSWPACTRYRIEVPARILTRGNAEDWGPGHA